MRLCQEAQDFIAEKTGNDCQIKKPYPPTSRKLQCRCRKCGEIDAKIAKARKILGNIRETMEEIERRGEEEKKECVNHCEDDENQGEEENEITSQGQKEESTPDQCEKRQEAKHEMEPRNEEDQQHSINQTPV